MHAPTVNLLAGFLLVAFPAYTNPVTKIVLSNDDGWAVAQIEIRFESTGLRDVGYAVGWDCFLSGGLSVYSCGWPQVVLSAPAEDKSGTGSDPAPPIVLTQPCEFNTCPTGSRLRKGVMRRTVSFESLIRLQSDIWTPFSFHQLRDPYVMLPSFRCYRLLMRSSVLVLFVTNSNSRTSTSSSTAYL